MTTPALRAIAVQQLPASANLDAPIIFNRSPFKFACVRCQSHPIGWIKKTFCGVNVAYHVLRRATPEAPMNKGILVAMTENAIPE